MEYRGENAAVHVMPDENATEIEVEVVEIDGEAPVVVRPADDMRTDHRQWTDWRQWQGRVTKLDGRWWPLWTLLGIIALVVLLTFGLVIAAVYGIFRMIAKLVRVIAG